jgi:hypothetical protein
VQHQYNSQFKLNKMKFKSITYVVSALALVVTIFFACKKNNSQTGDLQLTSPDNVYKLASSVPNLTKMIEVHTGQKGIKKIDKVEYINFKGKWGALVNYTLTNNATTTIVFSNKMLNSVSDQLTINTDKNVSNSENATASKTYSYTCTVKTGCDKCQVQVTDPWNNPVITCTCDKCQLNVTVKDTLDDDDGSGGTQP